MTSGETGGSETALDDAYGPDAARHRAAGLDQHQEIACVANNPGLWMLHCHILEHQEAAMTGVVSVT